MFIVMTEHVTVQQCGSFTLILKPQLISMAQRNTDKNKNNRISPCLSFRVKQHVSVRAVCLHHIGEHVSSK